MDKKTLSTETIIQRIILILFGLGVLALIVFACISIYFLSPVNSKSDSPVEFTVESGWAKRTIAEELSNAGLIRNPLFFLFYLKINNQELFAGTYRLCKSMSVNEIIRTLNSGNSLENETLTITFIEGKRLTTYARRIADTFDFEYDEVYEKLTDKEFIESLIEKYWFMTDIILHKDIRYALEGYLFPDTYIIRKNATIEDIVHRMLLTMDQRLTIYKDEITASKLNVHEILTLASIVELEVATATDRPMVAGVFLHRLHIKMPLGSCVTTYYAVGRDKTSDLTVRELNTCSPYNTRGVCAIPALPIGPIASPSLASIAAVLEPIDSEYLFFVSDKNGKMYYNKTISQHEATVRDLKRKGLWYEF